MKLLWASCCFSIVVPNKNAKTIKYCDCGNSCVWWDNPATGELGVSSNDINKVSVLGIHNGLLLSECSSYVDKHKMEEILKNTETNYLFKTMNSLIIRFTPGNTSDTRFVKLEELKDKL